MGYKDLTKSCHIYIIGLLPTVEIVTATQKNQQLVITVSVQGDTHDLDWSIPDGIQLKYDEKFFYLEDATGKKIGLNQEELMKKFTRKVGMLNFDIKYIGQAYGRDGSRNAIDRLLKHETLQKISLKGIPEGFTLSLLLLEVQPNNQIFTMFNPFAKEKDDTGKRVKAGLDKLFDTNEQEQITLYEASLIKYFSPIFNKEFKNSFPSTNLKVLQDCYKKDFSAVVAEICHDDILFRLCSDVVQPSHYHIAKHDLHEEANRKAFFYE